MANSKISALTSATTPLAGTETLPIVQSGSTKQVSVANLTAGRAVSTGALTVVGANATLDNAYSLVGKLAAGTPVGMIKRNSSNQVTIDEDGYGTIIGYGGRYSFSGGGDFSNLLGNYIPGTAGKGVNFTANTPTAGMTSQLLDWYEEGTWTPSQGAGLTVIGAFSSAGSYTRIGRQVTIYGYVAGATSVTASANAVLCANNPISASNIFLGSVLNNSGAVSGGAYTYTTSVYCVSAIAATPKIYFQVTYFV
jgi:hypothetical protein